MECLGLQYEMSIKNMDIVHLNDMNITTIASLDLGAVSKGDVILVSCSCIVYHTSDGAVHISVQKESDLATIAFGHDNDYLSNSSYNINGTQSDHNLFGICRVGNSGDLIIKLGGVTENTVTANVPAGFGQIFTAFIKKQ